MSVAKIYNSGTGQWEAAIVGKPGDPGVVQSDTAPSNTSVVWVDTDDTANTLLLPAGGSEGQVLAKASATNYDTEWAGPYAVSHNYIINGGFDIFQRGTSGSLSLSTGGYALDRWHSSKGGAGGVTISQQQTGSPIGSNYHARTAFTIDGSFSNYFYAIESGEVNTLQGKTVTLSVKLRRNATFTADLNVTLQKNATPDTLAGGTWTAIQGVSNANASLPTGTTSADWLTCTITAAIPDDGTANGLRIVISETTTSLNGAYYEVAEVQLEAGSVATPFKRNAPSLGLEEMACKRYYEEKAYVDFAYVMTGQAVSTSEVRGVLTYLPKRASPSVVVTTSLKALRADAATRSTSSAVSFTNHTLNDCRIFLTGLASMVAGNASIITAENGTKFQISAEL